MIELREDDALVQSWPPHQVLPALERFWDSGLTDDTPFNEWPHYRLCIPGKPDLEFPRYLSKELLAFGVRRREPGFLAELARLHAERLDVPLELGALLHLLPPRTEGKVQEVIEVLRKELSLTLPLVHAGLLEESLSAPPGDSFRIAESHGWYINGAGTGTALLQWQLDVRGPLRLRVLVEAQGENGAQAQWTITLSAPPSTASLQPLLDAFKEQGLSVRSELEQLEP